MVHVQADNLSFTLPASWDEVTLGQFLAYLNAKNDSELLSILSGIAIEELRPQQTPDLSRIVGQLAYLQTIPDWKTWPAPTRLTVDGKEVKLRSDLGEMATLGQMWDFEKIYHAMLATDQTPTYLTMVHATLSINLYPEITGEKYTDSQQASTIIPLLDTLPVNDMLPLAAFLFERSVNPPASGKITVTQIPKVKAKAWYNLIGRVWPR